MFRVELLPAAHGDCLWVSYGAAAEPYNMLIDGGPGWTYPALRERVLRLPTSARCLELLVITHVDADHIAGALELLRDQSLGLEIREVWFNGWRHLRESADDLLGPVQGEMLSALIGKRGLPWNTRFGGGAVVVPAGGALRPVELPGGLRLVVLSPTPRGLARLRREWADVVTAAGLRPGSAADAVRELRRRRPDDVLGGANLPHVAELAVLPFQEDSAAANASSIALLAEYRGARCLLAGDAQPGTVTAGVRRYLQELGRAEMKTDALKLSHHGSRGNNSPELIQLLRARKYLFSTSGAYFEHPHPETVARVLQFGGEGSELYFNYRTEQTDLWGNGRLRRRYKYKVFYGAAEPPGVAVDL
jgi:beta-lactamase superfamily II metal-dependent hydrolase